MLFPVILTGGSGTRLWPLSRATLPKQLLPLTGERSPLQETLLRLKGAEALAAPVVLCSQEHRFLVAEQLREIEVDPLVLMLEPAARSTAPAVTIAALHLIAQAPDAMMLVLPSDHVIADVPAFHRAIRQATQAASEGYLVTFGILPHAPETGYGYIQRGRALSGISGNGVAGEDDATEIYEVSRFVEKPDAAIAQGYLESGDYLWNSGMFLFSAVRFLEEMEKFRPDIVSACRSSLDSGYSDLDFYRLGAEAFQSCPADSIDFAVMEKTECAAVVPTDIGWNDIGSWSALWDLQDKDEQGNVAIGEVLLEDSRNCYVNAQKRIVATVGVDDLVIVETADAILVAHRDKSQDVKKIVDRLKRDGRTEYAVHKKSYRPWGSYEGVDRGDRFQVKRITVNPDAKLSLQMHHHRSEHWVVVSGTAEVTIGDVVRLVSENESVYIPLGANHRLHNPGRIPLHLIEVQSGSYLGEDDIVRLEDVYGRGN